MTSKELLYVEDALGHEKFMQTSSQNTAGECKDVALTTLLENLAKKHTEIYNNFFNLL